MKHYYQNIQGWVTYPNFYTNIIKQSKSGFHIVEVGAWKGMSAVYMGVEIINSGLDIKFDCIDTWNGSEEHLNKSSQFYEPLLETKDGLYNHFLQNIKPVEHVVNPIRMTSLDASKLYSDESLDCVFIDASHDYENVVNDINAWLPKVKKGRILSGHDFIYPPVYDAIVDTLGKEIINTPEDIWIFKK